MSTKLLDIMEQYDATICASALSMILADIAHALSPDDPSSKINDIVMMTRFVSAARADDDGDDGDDDCDDDHDC